MDQLQQKEETFCTEKMYQCIPASSERDSGVVPCHSVRDEFCHCARLAWLQSFESLPVSTDRKQLICRLCCVLICFALLGLLTFMSAALLVTEA